MEIKGEEGSAVIGVTGLDESATYAVTASITATRKDGDENQQITCGFTTKAAVSSRATLPGGKGTFSANLTVVGVVAGANEVAVQCTSSPGTAIAQGSIIAISIAKGGKEPK